MSGIFEHLSAFDESEWINKRKAAAVAGKRFQDHFGGFLRSAVSDAELEQRVALIEEDIQRIAQDVADEYSADAEKLASTLLRTARGGFCDECRVWKSGPNKGECTCDGSTSDPDEGETESEPESESKEARTANDPITLATHPITRQEPFAEEPGEGVTDIDHDLMKAPSAVGEDVGAGIVASTPTMHRARQLMAARHAEDLTTGDTWEQREKLDPSPPVDSTTGLSTHPSGPKIKKRIDHGQEPIDTDAGPYQTETQDIKAKPDWEAEPFAQTGKGTTERVELDTAGDWEAGFATGGEENGPHTDTWSGTEGLADPVTNVALSSTAGFSVVPMTPEHAQALQVDNPGATGREAYAVVDDQGKPHAAFDQQEEMGWGGTQAKPEYQNAIDRTKPHIYPQASVDPDKNPIREVLESGFIPASQVESAIADYEGES